ncbi:MAG TPA: hypothetical protein VN611_05395 [Patescibacteria group bacterium]|nr:hypothetical protein [Patescibacteria group bacterium]
MNYQRFKLAVGENSGWDAVRRGLAEFDGWIIVNVSGDENDTGVLFLMETVQEFLDSGKDTLWLEGVNREEYYELLSEQIDQFLDLGRELRQRLCLWRARQMQLEIQDYLNRVQNFRHFICCHDCQQEALLPAPVFKALFDAAEQLAVAAFAHEDNVRCMDHLEYELAPCLLELRKKIEQRQGLPKLGKN